MRIERVGVSAGVLALVAITAACRSDATPARAAAPQTIEIGTTELDGRHGVGFVLTIHRLRITRRGWSVEAGVRNATPVIWTVSRPHVLGGTKFGLFVARRRRDLTPARLEVPGHTTPQLLAERFDPPLPGLPGELLAVTSRPVLVN